MNDALIINSLLSTLGWIFPILFAGAFLIHYVGGKSTWPYLRFRKKSPDGMFLFGMVVLVYAGLGGLYFLNLK